ncbi:MAG: AIPR family protein [Alphaproteobacteria bacterium]|nr:AIPR family protein [Alphaproteobacteria bacterium]
MAYDTPSSGKMTFTLHYHTIKSLTSPEEKSNGVQTWFANISAREVTKLGTQDNLRTYIAEHKDSKRNKVHKEIEAAILEHPDRFINRNSGVTITCTDCTIDDSKRTARLKNASIINGAQTQGELKRYFASIEQDDETDFPVRAEIIMEPQHEQIVEVAIARNTATSVKSVSQAGARGYLDDLHEAIQAGLPGETLQMNETDIEGLSAQAVLQWCRTLMPAEIEPSGTKAHNMPYKQAGKCLKDFGEWAQARKTDREAKRRYDFTVQIAVAAIQEYRFWESHAAWNGHRLHEKSKSSNGGSAPKGGRPVRRGSDGKINWVAPGLLFPILSALSAFVVEKGGNWTIEKPSLFDPTQMIDRAVKQYRALDRQVAYMGRSEAAYDALSIYTDTIATVIKSQSA